MTNHRPLPELLALLRQALTDLPADALAPAVTAAEEADTELQASLEGTTNETAKQALSSNTQGRISLDTATGYLATFQTELRAYYSNLTGSQPDTPPSAAGMAAAEPSPTTDSAATSWPPSTAPLPAEKAAPASSGGASAVPVEPFDPAPLLVDMPEFIHKPGFRAPKTEGRWVDETGKVHPLRSGEDDPAFHQAKQKAIQLGILRGGTLTTTSHVELKFSMRIREGQHERLVINHPDGPCAGRYSCERLLPYFLPTGAQLTVYWPNGNKTFKGKDRT